MVCSGISLSSHTDLIVIHGGTLTEVDWDKIHDPYVRLYGGAIYNRFILLENNARLH